MGKVVKKSLGFIGAVVVSAIGVVLAPVTGGASLVIAGKIATVLFLSNVASLAGSIIAPKPKGLDGADARGTAFADPGAAGAFVFGETAAPMALVFEQNHGTDKEFVSDVFAHAWHEIDSYQSLHVDGELVTFSGDAATGAFANILTWKRNPGTAAQAALSLAGTVWPATANGKGVAHSALVWNFKNQDKLKGGVPNRLVVKVRGAKLYDPRLDSTAGGAGAQRYSDPSTWTWNDGNAALVALRYLIGEKSAGGTLIWGVGEAQGDVDLASFMTAANIADELRDGVKRHRLGGVFATSNDHEEFFGAWEANTGGKISRIGGKRFCWLPNNDLTPIATIGDKDFLGEAGIEHIAGGDLSGLYNTARGRYISAAELYQAAPWPEVEEATAVADDGKRRVLDLDFGWVQDIASAERIARLQVRRSRFQRVWRAVLGWQGFLYAPFDVLTLNCQETNFIDQLVRIVDMQMSAAGAVALTLQEEDAAIYDETLPLGTPPAAGAIPDRLDRLATLTPRYIDGTSVDQGSERAGTAGPLVKNGSFEAGDRHWTKGAGWSIVSGETVLVGTKSAKFVAGGASALVNDQNFGVHPGERFLARCQAFASGATAGSIRVRIDWLDAAGAVLSSAAGTSIAAGTAGWAQSRARAVAPASAAKARIAVEITGAPAGTFYVDQVRATEELVDSDIDALATANGPAEAGANVTESRTAAGIAGQGALATRNNVDIASGDVVNQSLAAVAGSSNLNNLIVNPSFEDGLAPHAVISTAGGAWSVVDIATAAKSGAKVLRFARTSAGGGNARVDLNGSFGAKTNHPAAAEGDVFTASVWIKLASGAASRVRIQIQPRKTDTTTAPGANNSGWVTPTASWLKISARATIGAGAAYVQVWLEVEDSANVGSMDFDGAEHRQAADAVTQVNSPLASPNVLNENTQKNQGGTPRAIPVDAAEEIAFDGDTVIFSQNWGAPPLIRFGGGGRGYNPSFAASQQQVFRALNVTASGFTASLRLKETSETTTPVSDGPGAAGGGGDPDLVIEKSASGQDKDDTYRFSVSVNGDNPIDPETGNPLPSGGFATVGFYTRKTALDSWAKAAEVTYNTSGTFTIDITVDGLGVDAAFGVTAEAIGAGAGNGITAFGSVAYTTQAAVNETSATPSGASGVPFHQIGNKAAV